MKNIKIIIWLIIGFTNISLCQKSVHSTNWSRLPIITTSEEIYSKVKAYGMEKNLFEGRVLKDEFENYKYISKENLDSEIKNIYNYFGLFNQLEEFKKEIVGKSSMKEFYTILDKYPLAKKGFMHSKSSEANKLKHMQFDLEYCPLIEKSTGAISITQKVKISKEIAESYTYVFKDRPKIYITK